MSKRPIQKPIGGVPLIDKTDEQLIAQIEPHWMGLRELLLQKHMGEKLPAAWVYAFEDPGTLDPLYRLMNTVSSGAIPSPKTLVGIMRAFEKYVQAQGKMTLEEAFFGKPKRKTGNHSKRLATWMMKFGQMREVAYLVAGGESVNAASVKVADAMSPDVDPFTVRRRYHEENGPVAVGIFKDELSRN